MVIRKPFLKIFSYFYFWIKIHRFLSDSCTNSMKFHYVGKLFGFLLYIPLQAGNHFRSEPENTEHSLDAIFIFIWELCNLNEFYLIQKPKTHTHVLIGIVAFHSFWIILSFGFIYAFLSAPNESDSRQCAIWRWKDGNHRCQGKISTIPSRFTHWFP